MAHSNHYETLNIKPTATQAEIKQAYRRLVKLFHPDTNREMSDREQIIRINAAYEILSDPQQRDSYDQQLKQHYQQHRRVVQNRSRQQRKTGREADVELEQWLLYVYKPVNQKLARILNPLRDEIDELSADPFDDELIEAFQEYLDTCRELLQQAQACFRSLPNPSNVAGVAAHLYFCLNQVGDGIEELQLFTLNYDDRHLHTGQELFRIAARLRREAQQELKS